MRTHSKKGFTLVELMIVIVIITLMMLIGYAPYNYYQQKAKVKIAGREISQSINEARNMALSGVSEKEDIDGDGVLDDTNRSIGIEFISGENKIKYYTFPYRKIETINDIDYSQKIEYKEKPLQNSIVFKGVTQGNPPTKSSSEFLIFFEAITGKLYFKDLSGAEFDEDTEIIINYGVKDSTNTTLNKELKYYPTTNTTFYKSN